MVQRQGEEKPPPPPSCKFNEAEGSVFGLRGPWVSHGDLHMAMAFINCVKVGHINLYFIVWSNGWIKKKSQEFCPSADGDLDAVVTGHHQHRV